MLPRPNERQGGSPRPTAGFDSYLTFSHHHPHLVCLAAGRRIRADGDDAIIPGAHDEGARRIVCHFEEGFPAL